MILRRHGCPAAFARRLPQSNGSPAPFTALHAASPAQRKKKLRCAQEAHVSTRAQRSGDAQGGTADDGPGVVSQVVSQVVKNAPAREEVAAGTATREGSGRSDEVVVPRSSVARGKSRRRKWINGRDHCSKLGSGWRARDGFSGSSRLTPAQPHASTGASQFGLLHQPAPSVSWKSGAEGDVEARAAAMAAYFGRLRACALTAASWLRLHVCPLGTLLQESVATAA